MRVLDRLKELSLLNSGVTKDIIRAIPSLEGLLMVDMKEDIITSDLTELMITGDIEITRLSCDILDEAIHSNLERSKNDITL